MKPHFYVVKLGFIGVYIIFLISVQNIDCGYSLEPPRRGGSNECHNLCFEQKYEKYHKFCLEIFPFLVVQFSIYLNRRVFVMQNFMEFKIFFVQKHNVVAVDVMTLPASNKVLCNLLL